jgi:hypothetical protein
MQLQHYLSVEIGEKKSQNLHAEHKSKVGYVLTLKNRMLEMMNDFVLQGKHGKGTSPSFIDMINANLPPGILPIKKRQAEWK